MGLFTTPLAGAIANAEGYGQPGTIPTRANNPGDLAIGDIGYGTMGQGITVFPDLSSGVSALENQVQKMLGGTSSVYSPDMSIAEAGGLYSGGDANWAANVAKSLGLSTSDPLSAAGSASTSSSSSSSATTSSWIQGALNAMGIGVSLDAVSGASDSITSLSSFSVQRIVFIVLGLIIIGAGLFSFKPVQGTVLEFGKGVVEGAKTAAMAA